MLQPILVRRARVPVGGRSVRADRRRAALAGGQAGRARHDPGHRPAGRRHGRLEQALVENLHREDLNPLEEAAAYQQLIEDFGLTQEQVAARVGRSRSAVANTLRLFQLPPASSAWSVDGQLSAGHARALLGTPDRSFQEALAERICREGLSVRQTEEAVRAAPSCTPSWERPRRRRRPDGAADAGPLEADAGQTGPAGARRRRPVSSSSRSSWRLPRHPGADQRSGDRGAGSSIDFADLEDLERIYRVMADPSA